LARYNKTLPVIVVMFGFSRCRIRPDIFRCIPALPTFVPLSEDVARGRRRAR
jgi:hypothetical protein